MYSNDEMGREQEAGKMLMNQPSSRYPGMANKNQRDYIG